MATNMKICTTLYTLVFLFTLCLFSSHAAFSSTPNGSCDTTPYPAFCKTTLPASQYLSIQDQCRFFPQQSLSITKTIFNLVSSYLRDPYTIPHSTVHALEDCLNLSELNSDFLSNVLQAIENTLASYEEWCRGL